MFRFPGRRSEDTDSPVASSSRRSKKNQDEGDTTSKNKNKASAQLPAKLKRLRACMICSLIKSEAEFEEDGCDNCESFLHLRGTQGAMMSYTSANFEGLIGMVNPNDSWVARWQRISTGKPGTYAVNVRGEVEKWVKDEMTDAGLQYACRDKAQLEDKGEVVRHKRRKRTRGARKSKKRSELESNGRTVTPDTNDQHLEEEEPDELDETRQNVREHDGNETPEATNLLLTDIKEEPMGTIENGQEADTVSLVGNMPYRSGRRYSSSSSSDESDGQGSNQGSLSP